MPELSFSIGEGCTFAIIIFGTIVSWSLTEQIYVFLLIFKGTHCLQVGRCWAFLGNNKSLMKNENGQKDV